MRNVHAPVCLIFFASCIGIMQPLTASADDKSSYQQGFQDGFNEARKIYAGGGGTHGLKPGDIIWTPDIKSGGGGTSSDIKIDPLVMIYDGTDWSSLSIPRSLFSVGPNIPKINDVHIEFSVNGASAAFWGSKNHGDLKSAADSLQQGTGLNYIDWTKIISASDIGGMQPGYLSREKFNFQKQ